MLIASIQNQFERVNVGHSGVKCATSVRVCVTQEIASKKSNKEKEGSGGGGGGVGVDWSVSYA